MNDCYGEPRYWRFRGRLELQEKVGRRKNGPTARIPPDELTLRSPGVMKKLSLDMRHLMGRNLLEREPCSITRATHHLGDQNMELLWPLSWTSVRLLIPNLLVA